MLAVIIIFGILIVALLIWVLVYQYKIMSSLKKTGRKIIMTFKEEVDGIVATVDAATTAVAAKIDAETAKIAELLAAKGATPEEIQAMKDGFAPITANLINLAKPPIQLTTDQVNALVAANLPYDGVSPSLTAEQLKALKDAGFPYTPPTP